MSASLYILPYSARLQYNNYVENRNNMRTAAAVLSQFTSKAGLRTLTYLFLNPNTTVRYPLDRSSALSWDQLGSSPA